MKITQLFKIYWPDNGGGIAKVMESIADGFSGCRQEIIVCQNSRRKPGADDAYKGIPVRRCRQLFDFASTPVSIQFLLDVRKRTKDSDIVIYHFPYPMADIAFLLGLCPGKRIVWWHCGIEKYNKLAPIYLPFIKHTLKQADRILVSSQGNIEHSKILKPYRKKCTVIPFSVSDEYLAEGRKYAQSAQEKNADINILFVGRLVWYKGCDILLKAFALLQKKYQNCRLVLVGQGPLEQELKNLAAALNLRGVEFTGMITEEEKMQRIKNCDFLVLPSISKAEAFGLVQIEAMAFGKPVVNTRLPSGVPYVSIDGITGKTVEPGRIRPLAQAMETLMLDEALRQQYGQNALKMVEREYTRSVMIKRYKRVFQLLTGRQI